MYASTISRPPVIQPCPYGTPSHTFSSFLKESRAPPLGDYTKEADHWSRTSSQTNSKQGHERVDYPEQCKRLETWRMSVCEPFVKHKGHKKMSEESRKERNRRLAKEFRAKKKMELQLYQRWVAFLQGVVNELKTENDKLRQLVSDTSACSKDRIQESSVLSISDRSKEEQAVTIERKTNPTFHQDLALFSDTALKTKHIATTNLTSLPCIFDSNGNPLEEGYPLSPVSEQVSPCRIHDNVNWQMTERNQSNTNAVDRKKRLSTGETSVLGIDSLVHF
ncbi:hypothetical protein Gasu2_06540 [Galdieria sulphuraria]|uniref:BZIP domain-containing protein n=1 Tax=Galdieria sulphuraria TaxID=130081 RepID=M2Y2H3_GALSU|nr:uncharacterized protein Gasu_26020 [Galdieria sulphuraria]EME30014.1 hypothetical protein Gasu_26020 [Galdieria sulphuraria]GJD06226.1 hypothetical protein Gasu2_06540 [Galdieria sulphuraria]|eukprot:XP_005706534.1 hypothetical protein Gasu_26020 [Galdieria sulphuraria]